MIYVMLTLTLLLGTVLSFHSKELTLYYAAFYGLCLFALRSINYGKDFFLSFASRIQMAKERKIIVAGEETTPKLEEDKQEDRFLGIFAPEKMVKRRVLTWLLFFSGLWFFHYRQGIEFSMNTIIPLFSCVLIVNSFYVGHFLVSLLLNLFLVVANFSRESSLILYLAYAFLFLACLYLIGTKKNQLHRKKVTQLFGFSVMLLTLTYGFTWILPAPSTSDEKKVFSPEESKFLKDQLKKMRLDLGKMQLKLPMGKMGPLLDEIGQLERQIQNGELSAEERKSIQERLRFLIKEFNDQKLEFDSLPDIDIDHSALSVQDKRVLDKLKMKNSASIEELSDELAGIYEEIAKVQKNLELADLSGAERKALEDQLQKLMESADGLKNPDELTREERNTLTSYVNRNAKEDVGEIQALLDQEKLSPPERQAILEKIHKIESGKHTRPQAPEISEVSSETERDLLKSLDEDKAVTNTWLHKLKRLLPFMVLMFVIILLNYFLRKKGIKKIEAADPEMLAALKKEWKLLHKMKLSPREEVIHYYNLFHESVQKLHYASHEAPPSCIINEDMKEFHPALEKPTLVLTEVFAQCYYGDKNVTPDALKLFRKAVTKILKVYQLT